jgi:hypothetical protein
LDAPAADRGVLFASDTILPRSIQQNKSRYIPNRRVDRRRDGKLVGHRLRHHLALRRVKLRHGVHPHPTGLVMDQRLGLWDGSYSGSLLVFAVEGWSSEPDTSHPLSLIGLLFCQLAFARVVTDAE